MDRRTTSPSASGSLLQFKRNLNQNASPRSPLSPVSTGYLLDSTSSSIDHAINDAIADNSIEHLYNNIYEMKSSDRSTPSICSFTTYGNESRVDSELRHLVGADRDVEEEGCMPRDRDVVRKQKEKSSLDSSRSSSSVKGFDSSATSSSCSSKEKVSSSIAKKPAKSRKDRSMKSATFSTKGASSWLSQCRGVPHEKPPTGKTKPIRTYRKASSLDCLPPKEEKSSKLLQKEGEDALEMGFNNPDLGPYLLKKAREMISTGDNKKAFDMVQRAKKSFENCHNSEKPNLDFVMCLHILASMCCSSSQYEEAILLLERSIEIPVVQMGQDHALAKFAGLMQLGDIYSLLGQMDSAIDLYKAGLEVQRAALGEKDARFGETCRYVAEALVQALRFDEAKKLCEMALNTNKEYIQSSSPVSIEEGANRRLMGLICESKGDHEAALEHYALASLAVSSHGQDLDTAAVNCNMGDAYLALCRYKEAVSSYKKALEMFSSSKGENHPSVASVFVRLADLCNKLGKFDESKSHCERALRIYNKPAPGVPPEEIACGLIDLASIFESMGELQTALCLLQRVLDIYRSLNGANQDSIIAGIEAQTGVLHYMLGNYGDSYTILKNAAPNLQSCGKKSFSVYGIVLNQMGLACVHLEAMTEALVLFKEAKAVLEDEYGPHHPETLAVYSNLAGMYDALGRWDEAIETLEFVVGVREEKLGTADPIVDNEKKRLAELLKESGRGRRTEARSLETLLDIFSDIAAGQGVET